MPITLRWENDNVIVQEFGESFTLDEYIASIDDIVEILEDREDMIHIIGDMRGVKRQPSNLLKARHRLEEATPANRGCVVVLGANRFVRLLIEAIRPIAPRFVKNLSFADTFEEALTMCAKYEV